MRFCMVTTFFGALSFGGDAAYVDRLSRALARRGHGVDVVHCADAFTAVGERELERPYEPPAGVRIHTLRSRLGRLSALWTHQTGRAPAPKAEKIRRLFASEDFDVIHFHNISLVGGPRVLSLADQCPSAVRLLSAHEHWLVCPMHHLWKFGREVCERPQCVRCTLHGRRPPQLWRHSRLRDRMLEEVDAVVFPSGHALEAHRERGIDARLVQLPYFLPDGWGASGRNGNAPPERPYLAAAGRLVQPKGFQELIAAIARLPGLELRIAGAGAYDEELRRLAAHLPNVRFLGMLGEGEIARLFRGAVAVVLPSLSYETFGYVALESFSVGTPVIARRLGALVEVVDESGGGLLFETTDELVDSIRRLADDPALRTELGRRGRETVETTWSERVQVDAYLHLVEALAGAERVSASSRASAAVRAAEA